jgi:5-methylcytosine-specific restriction enzyme A
MEKPKARQRPWKIRPQKKTESRTMDSFYHTARWTKESRRFRIANPVCKLCQEEGLINPSQVTDHIIPKEICGDPWDKNNWQALCYRHHQEKAAKDKILINKYRKIHNK